jgi:hypothetical protein
VNVKVLELKLEEVEKTDEFSTTVMERCIFGLLSREE